MKYLKIIVISLSLLPFASNANWRLSGGDKFDLKYNAHGAVLTSQSTKHFVETPRGKSGAETKVVSRKIKLYLGADCDAASNMHQNGTWGWANGGFSVEFPDVTYSFYRQGISIPNNNSKCFGNFSG
jgi:hypothetical protein